MGDISNIFNSETNFKSNIDRLSKFPFRIFYFAFVPKSFRKKLNRKANILQKKHVELCWDIFLDYYFSNQLEKYQIK